MGKRRLAREYCLQALYLADLAGFDSREICVALELNSPPPPEDSLDFAKKLLEGTLANSEKIDSILQEHVQNWKLDRMSVTDRCVLRLATYELLFSDQTPPAVVMDEAIELGKKFSTENSGRFINGILDKIRLSRQPAAQDPPPDANP